VIGVNPPVGGGGVRKSRESQRGRWTEKQKTKRSGEGEIEKGREGGGGGGGCERERVLPCVGVCGSLIWRQ